MVTILPVVLVLKEKNSLYSTTEEYTSNMKFIFKKIQTNVTMSKFGKQVRTNFEFFASSHCKISTI